MASNIWSGSGFTTAPAMASGSYNPDDPPWPAGQVPGFGFAADPTTGFVYIDNGQAKEMILVAGGVEAARIENKYTDDPDKAFLVVTNVHPDTDRQSESTCGIPTSPYALGCFDSVSLGLGTGADVIITPSNAPSAPIIFDYTDRRGYSFGAYDGVGYCAISMFATGGADDPRFTVAPVDSNHSLFLGGKDVVAAPDDWFYFPAVTSDPVATPGTRTGSVPIQYNTTNNKLWIYNGAWKSVTLS